MLKPWSIRLDMATQPILWLDVERRKADSEPAMSTILNAGELITYVHDERLRPAAQSSGGGKLATYRTWGETVDEILDVAGGGVLIGGYSLAELKLLQEARPAHAEWLEARYLNANAGPWFRKQRPELYAQLESTIPAESFGKHVGLTHFLSLREVGYHVPNRLEDFSPAETIKRVREGLAKNGGSYGQLPEALRISWRNLIKYNQHDVKGMCHLAKFMWKRSRVS
jgi:hypothetical protein